MSKLIFQCPKCKTGSLDSATANEKNDVTCDNPKCRRRWRLMPDHQSIMGAATVLKVDNVQQTNAPKKVGGSK